MITSEQAARARLYLKTHPGTSWRLALEAVVGQDAAALGASPPLDPRPGMALSAPPAPPPSPAEIDARLAALEHHYADARARRITARTQADQKALIAAYERDGFDPFQALTSAAMHNPELARELFADETPGHVTRLRQEQRAGLAAAERANPDRDPVGLLALASTRYPPGYLSDLNDRVAQEKQDRAAQEHLDRATIAQEYPSLTEQEIQALLLQLDPERYSPTPAEQELADILGAAGIDPTTIANEENNQ